MREEQRRRRVLWFEREVVRKFKFYLQQFAHL